MPTTRFLLIRHAESLWNAQGRWQGQADPELSPRGRAQAKALAERLARERLDALLASDLRRALETARFVGAPHGLLPEPEPRLRELDVGEWSGLGHHEIESRAPEALARFQAGHPDVRPAGGETRREIRFRVRHAMAEIAEARAGQRVAVVTHLGAIRALLPGSELGNAEWLEVPAEKLASPDDPTD